MKEEKCSRSSSNKTPTACDRNQLRKLRQLEFQVSFCSNFCSMDEHPMTVSFCPVGEHPMAVSFCPVGEHPMAVILEWIDFCLLFPTVSTFASWDKQ